MAKEKDNTEHALIRDLASLLNETGLSEIEIERNGLKVRVARQIVVQAAAASAPQPAQLRGGAPSAAQNGTAVAARRENHRQSAGNQRLHD